ncbi:MAG: alpha-ketoglutarate-dependent dioxygenase AlkB [Novosphingobium sp.]|nr:alpha-ketoglutarate-dependent dioxygenase AlkB [Novosphingobium sp.]
MVVGTGSTQVEGLVPGLKLVHEILTVEEEADLISLIEASQPARSPYDPDNPRSSTSYGWKYDYGTDSFVACDPMPQGFRSVAQKAADLAGVRPEDLAECLLNRYEAGAIIQPHFDKPVWDHVIGISLGAPTTMQFSRQGEASALEVAIALPPRSMYLLAGDARHVWQHSLPPMAATRWSITFRDFSEEGRRRHAQAA